MNFNLYLDREAAEKLDRVARKTRTPRNALIREAVRIWLEQQAAGWPKEVLEFRGDPKFVPFESHRNELGAPIDDPFAAALPPSVQHARRRRSVKA